jgi:hypothetical protein
MPVFLAPQVGLEPTTLRLTEVREAISHLCHSVIPNDTNPHWRAFKALSPFSLPAAECYLDCALCYREWAQKWAHLPATPCRPRWKRTRSIQPYSHIGTKAPDVLPTPRFFSTSFRVCLFFIVVFSGFNQKCPVCDQFMSSLSREDINEN